MLVLFPFSYQFTSSFDNWVSQTTILQIIYKTLVIICAHHFASCHITCHLSQRTIHVVQSLQWNVGLFSLKWLEYCLGLSLVSCWLIFIFCRFYVLALAVSFIADTIQFHIWCSYSMKEDSIFAILSKTNAKILLINNSPR